MRCPGCGTGMACSEEVHHYRECGLSNIHLMNMPVWRCEGCGERIISIPASPQLHERIARKLLAKTTILGGTEIRFLRKNMGLRAVDLQSMVGIDSATISRWENGKQRITPSHDRLLRMFYANYKGFPAEHNRKMVSEGFREIRPENADSTVPPYEIDVSRYP